MPAKVHTLHRVALAALLLGSVGAIVHAVVAGVEKNGAAGSADGGSVIRASRPLMGTTFKLSAWAAPGAETATAAALNEALDAVAALERRVSSWDPESDASAVNRAVGGEAVRVGTDLRDLVVASLDWAARTDGAFDPTGGPLFELWRRCRDDGVLPAADALAAARAKVDFRRVKLLGQAISLAPGGMKLGFGAIGKGFAADRAADVLRARAIRGFIIDAGGDLLVEGARGGEPWSVGVRHPREPDVLATLVATDCAMATSGDYEQFVVIDGTRYSHIVDPRSGWPAKGLLSVTVVARRGADADALATAVFVLGAKKGLDLVESVAGAEALVIGEDGGPMTSTGLALHGTQLVLQRKTGEPRS